MTENKNIKRKLIIQSFMPLYFILVIKNFDEEMLILVKKMTEHLLKRDFKIICNVVDHPLFLSCIFSFTENFGFGRIDVFLVYSLGTAVQYTSAEAKHFSADVKPWKYHTSPKTVA